MPEIIKLSVQISLFCQWLELKHVGQSQQYQEKSMENIGQLSPNNRTNRTFQLPHSHFEGSSSIVLTINLSPIKTSAPKFQKPLLVYNKHQIQIFIFKLTFTFYLRNNSINSIFFLYIWSLSWIIDGSKSLHFITNYLRQFCIPPDFSQGQRSLRSALSKSAHLKLLLLTIHL